MAHELCLTAKSQGTLETNVWRELGALTGDEPPRVYRTYCGTDIEDCAYILATTSKDLHLRIGLMSDHGRNQFCQLLEREFQQSKAPEILFSIFISKERGEKRNVMYVTRSRDVSTLLAEGDYLYHMSPAY